MEVLNIIIVSIGILGTFNNGILLLIFIINPLKTFKSTSTYFMKSLTVADFVTSLMTIIWGFHTPSGNFLRAYYFIFWMSIQISFYLIFLMSIERYIAVHYPLKKLVIVTRERTISCIVIVCLLSGILAGLSEFKVIRHYLRFSLFSLFDVIVISVAIVYIKIVVSLKKITNEARKSIRANSSRRLRLEKIREDRQLLIVVLVMVSILAITVLPYTIASQVMLVDILFYKNYPRDKKILITFLMYYFPVEIVNFVVNPIIYAIRLPNYRKSLTALLCFYKKTNKNETNQEMTLY